MPPASPSSSSGTSSSAPSVKELWPYPIDILRSILAQLDPPTLRTCLRVNTTWQHAAERFLMTRAVLITGSPASSLPYSISAPSYPFPPVPLAQLEALQRCAHLVTVLDVHPHRDGTAFAQLQGLELPNLRVLRLFFDEGRWDCGRPVLCSSAAAGPVFSLTPEVVKEEGRCPEGEEDYCAILGRLHPRDVIVFHPAIEIALHHVLGARLETSDDADDSQLRQILGHVRRILPSHLADTAIYVVLGTPRRGYTIDDFGDVKVTSDDRLCVQLRLRMRGAGIEALELRRGGDWASFGTVPTDMSLMGTLLAD